MDQSVQWTVIRVLNVALFFCFSSLLPRADLLQSAISQHEIPKFQRKSFRNFMTWRLNDRFSSPHRKKSEFFCFFQGWVKKNRKWPHWGKISNLARCGSNNFESKNGVTLGESLGGDVSNPLVFSVADLSSWKTNGANKAPVLSWKPGRIWSSSYSPGLQPSFSETIVEWNANFEWFWSFKKFHIVILCLWKFSLLFCRKMIPRAFLQAAS